MAAYSYSISQDLPGSQFGSTVSTILGLLCRDYIPNNSVTAIDSSGDSLTINFENPLSTLEKTILDGDTLNPAGGLIARSTDDYQIIFEPGARVETATEQALEPYPITENQISSNIITESEILFLPPDGITISAIRLQYVDAFGNAKPGYSNRIEFINQVLIPINTDVNTFDSDGIAEFIVGPSFDFGVVPIFIFASYLPFKGIQLRFSFEGS